MPLIVVYTITRDNFTHHKKLTMECGCINLYQLQQKTSAVVSSRCMVRHRKPDLIGAAIIITPTNHTHSFVQVMSCINRKDNTVVFLSNEPNNNLSLCSAYLIYSNATVISSNNSVQAIFYYITKQMTFITISMFIQIISFQL